jgi:hypothetical protein
MQPSVVLQQQSLFLLEVPLLATLTLPLHLFSTSNTFKPI